jgi:hypothetical protein
MRMNITSLPDGGLLKSTLTSALLRKIQVNFYVAIRILCCYTHSMLFLAFSVVSLEDSIVSEICFNQAF